MTTLDITASTVPARLRLSRQIAGIDQVHMAQRMRVARTTVSNWERGISEPTVSQFIEWAHQTAQPIDRLIDGLPGCTPWDLNPEPTDYGLDAIFWELVDQLEPA